MPRTLKPWLPHRKIEKEKINQLKRLVRIKEFLSRERYCS